MCEGQSHKVKDEERLRIAIEARSQEIGLFWQRSLFFWGFIAASFVALASAYGKHPLLAIAISCFGTVCSFCWTLANRGSRRWVVHWEKVVEKEQEEVIGKLFRIKMHPDDAKGWLAARRYSVSRLTIALSDFTFVLWTAMLIYQTAPTFRQIFSRIDDDQCICIMLVTLFSIIFLAAIFFCARSTRDSFDSTDSK